MKRDLGVESIGMLFTLSVADLEICILTWIGVNFKISFRIPPYSNHKYVKHTHLLIQNSHVLLKYFNIDNNQAYSSVHLFSSDSEPQSLFVLCKVEWIWIHINDFIACCFSLLGVLNILPINECDVFRPVPLSAF